MKIKRAIFGFLAASLALLGLTYQGALADRSGNLWNQPTDAYVITQDNSSGAHRDVGAPADRIPNGYFTNLNVSGACVGCGAGGGIGGGGTLNHLAKFTPDGTHVGNSLLIDDGTKIITPDNVFQQSGTTTPFSIGSLTSAAPDYGVLTTNSTNNILVITSEAAKTFDVINNGALASPAPVILFTPGDGITRNKFGVIGVGTTSFNVGALGGDDLDGTARNSDGVTLNLNASNAGSLGGNGGIVEISSGRALAGNGNGGVIDFNFGNGSGTGTNGALASSGGDFRIRLSGGGNSVRIISQGNESRALLLSHDSNRGIVDSNFGPMDFGNAVTNPDFRFQGTGGFVMRGLTYSFPTVMGGAGSVLTNNGVGSLTWSGAPGITGTGTSGQISFFTGANSIGGSDRFAWDNGASILKIYENIVGTAYLSLYNDGGTSHYINSGGSGHDFTNALSIPDGGTSFVINAHNTTTAGGAGGQGVRIIESALSVQPSSVVNSDAVYSSVQADVKDQGAGVRTYNGSFMGIYGTARAFTAASVYTELDGIFGKSTTNNGAVTTSAGVAGQAETIGGTTANAISLWAKAFVSSGGTITNAYGLKVDPPLVGTNQFTAAIGTGSSYVAGSLLVGAADVTANTFQVQGTSQFYVPDNTDTPFQVAELLNNYISVNTQNAAENVTFGNATTNPVYNFLGTGLASFVGNVSVPDQAYGVAWNGSTNVPTKNAVYDKIETMTTISATSASIGGGILAAGSCASTDTTVTGAAVGMSVVATPNTYPGDGSLWLSYVSAADHVITKICTILTLTPTASTYNIRVIK